LLIGDKAITTAILDRLFHRVEIIELNDNDSWRLRYQSIIFNPKSGQNYLTVTLFAFCMNFPYLVCQFPVFPFCFGFCFMFRLKVGISQHPNDRTHGFKVIMVFGFYSINHGYHSVLNYLLANMAIAFFKRKKV